MASSSWSPVEPETLTALWWEHWSASPPVAHVLRDVYHERWVRFHSLPEAKRYPEDADEWQVVLGRSNAVLDEVFSGMDVVVVTSSWSWDQEPAHQPGSTFWLTIPEENGDSADRVYHHVFATRRFWGVGCIDHLLREVANDVIDGVVISDTAMRCLYLPYDGGADVLLPTTDDRDQLRDRFSGWLSPHPSGL